MGLGRMLESNGLSEYHAMPSRNVNLTDALDQFVDAAVASGRYENASEVWPIVTCRLNVTPSCPPRMASQSLASDSVG
jgi:hypothetical protein